MKEKRKRLTALVLALCMCLGLLTVGASGETVASLDSGTGENTALPDYMQVELDDGELDYTSANSVTMQIPCESRSGIYFLNGSELSFYSLLDNTYVSVYTFSRCTSAYAANGRLYVLSGSDCYVFDLESCSLESTLTLDSGGTAIGADDSGRIYLAVSTSETYELLLYTPDGTLLSGTEVEARVYSFNGFDADTGRFFMESYYNWIYFGYDHPGRALTMGVVEDDQISFVDTSSSVVVSGLLGYNLNCIEYLCQNYYLCHQTGAAVIGGKYVVTSSVTYNRVQIFELPEMNLCLSLNRTTKEYDSGDYYYDTSCIGVRAVYNEAKDSIIVYENGKTLNEYDTETWEIIGTYQTPYYVFNILTMGDYVIVLEKEDGKYYMEVLNWGATDELSIKADKTVMAVGESQQLTLDRSTAYDTLCTWSSSDSSVVSVTDSGKIVAWKEGQATITCTGFLGITAEITITVSGSTVTTPSEYEAALSGQVTNNLSDNNYTVWSSTVDSYIMENADGTLTRVEYTGSGVLVETYSAAYQLLSSQTLPAELARFGGFFSGEDYNFLVFGQTNGAESDESEVVRVVKYDKSWNRVDACSIYGANTYIPFDAGSLRMAEVNGKLYIYTCHEMYADDDGTHHQANMTFVLDEASMEVEDGYYDVMNIAQAGYVSHSFNQFIQTDGTYVYRVDHGDANPRAVSITRCEVGGSVTSVSYTYALTIQGSSGANATGVSVGGFELSGDNCLIAGNSVDQSSSSTYSASGQRNIFLTVTDKKYLTTETVWLTNYSSSDGITPRTPQLVKLGEDQFLVMWEEYSSSTGKTTTKAVTVDGDGTQTSQIVSIPVQLSDCQPIVTNAGLVTWYVTDGSAATIYAVNPYDLPKMKVDVTELFTDVSAGSWYATYVQQIYDLGLMTGTSATTFEPNATTTRAMFVQSLYAYAGKPNVAFNSKFQDVSATVWYASAVSWAVANDVTSGTSDTTFSPNDSVTREQIALFLYAYAGRPEVSGQLTGFTDVASVHDYAVKAVLWCTQNGILNGSANSDGTRSLNPRDNAKRSEVATMLVGFTSFMKNQ